MISEKIIKLIDDALISAIDNHPPTKMPWCDPDFNIYQKCGIVVLEAAVAMQAANKFINENQCCSLEEIETDLIQTAAIAIRVLISIYE